MAQSTSNRPLASGPAQGSRARERAPARGPRSWSPLQPVTTYDASENRFWVEREMTLLERALADKGELRRGELGEIVGCKYWGPGRFARALKTAVEEGRIQHTGFGRYGPAN